MNVHIHPACANALRFLESTAQQCYRSGAALEPFCRCNRIKISLTQQILRVSVCVRKPWCKTDVYCQCFADVCLISMHHLSAGPNWRTFCLFSLCGLIALARLFHWIVNHLKLFCLWCFAPPQGIAMLTFALLMSARMGIFQETLYKEYGKHSKEALFYNVSRLLSLSQGHTQSQTALRGWNTSLSTVDLMFFPSAALPTSARLPAPLQWHLQPWRPLQPNQWALQEIVCCFWVSDDQNDAFLLPSSRRRPRGRPLCAHHVALPAGQHHHTVSSQILSIHSRM